MAVSTLSKFTVPLASDQSASNQGMLMPKLKYRFRISFENFGVSTPTTELTKQVASAARPNVQFEDIPIQVYNSMVHLAGRPKWQTFTVILRDDVSGAVSKLIGEQMQKQFDFFEQSSAASGIDYKFTMRIEILDGGNGANTASVLESWECYGCYVTQANYQSLSYAEQTPMTIDLTIQPDNCIQTTVAPGQGLGLGAAVGRSLGTFVTGAGT